MGNKQEAYGINDDITIDFTSCFISILAAHLRLVSLEVLAVML